MLFSNQYRHHHYFGESTVNSRIEAKIDDTDPSIHPRSFASPGVQRLCPEIFFRLVQATNSALLECVVRSIDESLLVKIESGGPMQYFATWLSSSLVISLLPIHLPLTFTT
ncbi:unnamed protein product [Musa acuminata subsp. malaccensis]|uniref:(wild Malaysian banana) hypothetical protein n=1 Tax=Musa acuminata subsp. malaccensis TaxID=214687 RepID=A0A8D7AAF3_MUSAM|nr:unnamed protein product [Musa acuminata subsp. malaccensis]